MVGGEDRGPDGLQIWLLVWISSRGVGLAMSPVRRQLEGSELECTISSTLPIVGYFWVSLPRIINPGPCCLPARTIWGGLSTIERKLGSSPGCCLDFGVVLEICLHWGHLELRGSFCVFLWIVLEHAELWNWRKNARGAFIVFVCEDLLVVREDS